MKITGLDIGGSYMKVAHYSSLFSLSSLSYDSIQKLKFPSGDTSNKDNFIDGLISVLQKFDSDAYGIAVAGFVQNGIVLSSPNIPALTDVNLCKIIKDKFKKDCVVGNDATLASYGEYRFGASRNSTISVCFTIGTGLGGGTVIYGQPLFGVSGLGMEIGHTKISSESRKCSCGNIDCVEEYVSARALVRFYGEDTKPENIIDLAKTGDTRARKAIDTMSEHICSIVVNAVHIFNPDTVVLAGGTVEHFPEIVDMVKSKFKNKVIKPFSCEIKKAELGEFSGCLGALAIAESFVKGK